MAYVLVCALRRIARGTIRLKLFKSSALVRLSVRRIKVAMAARQQRVLRSCR
jgi:hypothetical protein